MGGDQHFPPGLWIGMVETFPQTGDQLRSPVRVEMGLRFIQQKQAVGVFIQQAQPQTVQKLMLAVGKGFGINSFAYAVLFQNQILNRIICWIRRHVGRFH